MDNPCITCFVPNYPGGCQSDCSERTKWLDAQKTKQRMNPCDDCGISAEGCCEDEPCACYVNWDRAEKAEARIAELEAERAKLKPNDDINALEGPCADCINLGACDEPCGEAEEYSKANPLVHCTECGKPTRNKTGLCLDSWNCAMRTIRKLKAQVAKLMSALNLPRTCGCGDTLDADHPVCLGCEPDDGIITIPAPTSPEKPEGKEKS